MGTLRWLPFLLPLVAACASTADFYRAGGELDYASDFFVFVGHDAGGEVLFALDANRGRDGERFQAETFAVLRVEGTGPVQLRDDGAYTNPDHELASIPDSPLFAFEGDAERGFRITSAVNDLVLTCEPLRTGLERRHLDARVAWSSAPARLAWRGRRLAGTLLHEDLRFPGFNRLARTYPGFWDRYDGIWAASAEGDVLVWHTQRSARLAPLLGFAAGFAVVAGELVPLEGLAVETPRRRGALGFYSWPARWEGRFARGSFELELVAREPRSNWVLGGFATGLARGRLRLDGRTFEVRGLAELLQ